VRWLPKALCGHISDEISIATIIFGYANRELIAALQERGKGLIKADSKMVEKAETEINFLTKYKGS